MPQVHRVVAAQVVAKWLSGRVSRKLLEQLVDEVEYHQARNRQARKSHEKRTRRLLRERGVRLTQMVRCRRLSWRCRSNTTSVNLLSFASATACA